MTLLDRFDRFKLVTSGFELLTCEFELVDWWIWTSN